MVTGHNASHNIILEYITGQIPTQNIPLPLQITQTQNLSKHNSPDNKLPKVQQTPRRQNSDPAYCRSRLFEATAGISFQQRPQTQSNEQQQIR